MAEALGIAACIISLMQHLQSIAITFTGIQKAAPNLEQEYGLPLEMVLKRTALILEAMHRIGSSSTSSQEPLLSAIRELLQFTETAVDRLRKIPKRKLTFLSLENSRQPIKAALERVEAQFLLVVQLSGMLNATALSGLHSSLRDTLSEITTQSDRIHEPPGNNSYGLNILKEPSYQTRDKGRLSSIDSSYNFGILFIHGLNANSVSTWTGVDKYWPRDILPDDFPQACVMTYDYDSELAPSSMLSKNISPEKSLVYNIVDWQRSRSSALPLLFCAHSFGGILLQKAVTYCSKTRQIEKSSREFLSALKGIIFLGTPHLGSRTVSYRLFLERLAPSASRNVLKTLVQSVESTVEDADKFRAFAKDEKVPVLIFYESQPSTTPNGPIRIVTPERDFDLSDPFLLAGNHATMCRFQTSHDEGYVKIRKAITSIIAKDADKKASFQTLTKKRLEEINLLKPIKLEQELSAESRTLIQAQQDYSEKLRAFLRQLKEQIPVTGYSSDRLGESCDWVSTTDQFKTWRIDQSHPILVIVGHPGSGRSKVAEFVIDTLKENTKSQDRNADRSRITLSHFCRWTVPAEEQSNIWLYDILLQLLEAYPAMFKEIYRKLDSPPATYSDLEALLLRLLQASYLREVDIVVDGLDECGPESLRLMYKTIGQLGRLEEGPRIRHLLTTTSTTHILEPLQKKIISLALDSFPEHRNKQIMAFIENRLENSPNKHRYSDDFSILIRQELFKKASFQFHVSKKAESNLANDNDDSCSLYETRESEGNFNWILAAFDVVEGEKSIGAMRRRLATLPTHLKGLYDIFFERVPEAHKEFVAQVLHFTRCSFRPLESTTLTFALAIKDIHKTTSQVWEEQVIDLAGTIAPFTGDMVVFHNGCVAFTHRSLSTYLDSTAYVGDDSMNDKDGTTKNSFPRLNTRRTHCEMAAACLRCLMLDDSLDIDVDSSQTSKLPFINYAEAYWFKHAKNATGLHGELKSLIETFMNSPRMSKWLERRRKAQTEILLPEAEFQYHVLASLDLLGLTAIDETIKPLVNAKDSCGRTPLHYAIANNASKSIKWLLEEGANINVVDNDGFSCLHFAVSSGDLQLVRQFGNTDAVHPSLLNLAIERRNWNVVELLLDKIPHIPQPANDSWTEWKGKSGRGIIHQAVLSRNISIVESFLGKGANLSLIDDDGRTALHLAANIAERSIAEALLERAFALSLDSLLDTEDAEGNTALHLATESGDVEVISLLADQGADLSHLNKAGQLPLHIAAMYGYEKVVSFLLKIGSPIKTDNNQPSPLHLASAWGWSTVAKRLVRAGAAIEGRDNKGRTPIYLAASNGSKVMAELLLSFGAKAAVCDNDGITPLHIAALKGWEPVVALLLDAGADVNAKEKKHGQTILHFAAISKNPSDTLVQCLLDAKADITQKCDNGNTPLAAAQESGNTLIAELLSKAENGQPYAWNISSPKARLSRPQSTDSFGAATRLEILWEAEKREERQRVEVFDRL